MRLKRHSVQVVEHNPEWVTLGAEICLELQHVCKNLIVDVQHVGSTAVPELPAKPILDIAAAVDSFDRIPNLIQSLSEIGYLYRSVFSDLLGKSKEAGNADSHLFVQESSPGIRTIHLHIVEYKGTEWTDYICFRDVLRNEPTIRRQYAELKLELLSRFPNDRKSYTASKHDFIQRILKSKGSPTNPGRKWAEAHPLRTERLVPAR